MLADEIAKEIMGSTYFNKLFTKCMEYSYYDTFMPNNDFKYSEKEYRDLLRFADLLSISSDSQARSFSYKIITFLNLKYRLDPFYRTVAKSVYYNLGNFPAVNYLNTVDENNAELPLDKMVQVEAKKMIQQVPEVAGIYFTDTQYQLYSEMSRTREFSFSGPTSMGKSFIIKAFLLQLMNNKPPENMAVVVPTRALINQFAVEIKQELGEHIENNNYKIVTNSNVSELIFDNNTSLLMILTPERLISYITQNENPPLGFLFVDEAHKIAQDDTRSITTYIAIEKTLKKYPSTKLYFSSPNITNPEILLQLFNKTDQNIFRTDEATVAQNIFFADLDDYVLKYLYGDDFKVMTITIPQEASTINGFLSTYGKNSNLVYCNSVFRTIEYAIKFASTIIELSDDSELIKASRIISQYIHRDYYLTEIIKKGVAYHYGNMPQQIRGLVENLYKEGKIRYLFCTSTLLEGVNMPTQNLFILDNRQHINIIKPIDFWNLSGRAGRMAKELYGNVFCIKHRSSCNWNDISFTRVKNIPIVPTIYDRINKHLRQIEYRIKNNEVKPGGEEEILRYIANVICIDTLTLKTGYCSPIINDLIQRNKKAIVELAMAKSSSIEVPSSLLETNESIGIDIQNVAYKQIKKEYDKKQNIKLPTKIDYNGCLLVLEKFHSLYNWEITSKDFANKNRMRYYAFLMNQWINGKSLNQIISEAIFYYSEIHKQVKVSFNVYETFDRNSKKHINLLIGEIINDIERILRFQLEKYFNHYYMILKHILGVENAGENWATLLEYGTRNPIIIALQNIGLSRHTANEIVKHHHSSLYIEKGKLKGVNKELLLKDLQPDTLEYDEVKTVL